MNFCLMRRYIFRLRWNNYRFNSRKFERKEPCMQTHFYSHFSSSCHMRFLNNVSVTLDGSRDGSDPKKQEDYWKKALKAMTTYGLNIEDSD